MPEREREKLFQLPATASPVGQANLTPFTFVPILAKLPTKSRIILVGRKLLSAFHQNQSLEEPIKDTSYENTMDGGVYKAEFVYIGDSEENEPADSPRETTQAKKPCKIKSSYKALAAIPTNTLLLEQQAIDNEVEKKENSLDPSETFSMEEARAEMCSPAQLRAQSEELYAVIDEVLEESPIPFRRPLLSPSPTTRWEETDSVKRYTPRSSPRTVGRETKYANYHLQSPGLGEQHVTKPGVIRPTSVTSRLPTDNEEEEYIPNPFKTYQDGHLKNNPNKYACLLQGEPEADGGRPSSSQSSAKKSISSGGMTFGLLPPSLWLATTGDSQTGPSALTTTLAKMEVHETDI